MKKIFSISMLSLSIISVLISSCKKNNDNGTPATGTVYIHLHTNIDTNELDSKTQLYSDGNGRQFSLSAAQFFISNFKLVSANGTVVSIANARILKSIDSEQYLVGNAPIGTYTSVTFDVGLDDATNAMNPAAFTTCGYTSNSSMWYGNTTQGYMFMKLQGTADTTATQTGTNLVPFSYEIATAANRKTVSTGSRGTGAFSSYPVYTLLKDG
ncbi:MAG: MbnP family protein, partial [Flavipsychrobacter sp.]